VNCGAKNKKPIYKRWWFWVLAIIFVLNIRYALFPQTPITTTPPPTAVSTPQPTPRPTPTSTPTPRPTPTPTPIPTPISYIQVTATELLTAYDENEVAANTLYKGKWLEITGTIDDISVTFGITSVDLKNDKKYSFTDVYCSFGFNSNNDSDFATIKKGDVVTIRGRCDGLLLNISIQVYECSFAPAT
jgi:hypothetical protein